MRSNGNSQLIGASRVIADLKAEIERVARSDAKVLITGESGAGKEVVARAIHAASPRARHPFVPVNCAGIPETLLESELFGHVRGSFTGAYRDKPGKLEMADHGTSFMDEIGEMTLRMQGLLLRYLETGEIQKVGSENLTKATDVRVMAATNRELPDLIELGQFREDLYYRLNVIHIEVPALRERKEDIAELVEFFLERHRDAQRLDPKRNGHTLVESFSPDALKAMTEYSWPGNVRQVQNVVERLIVTSRNKVVQLSDLPAEFRANANGGFRLRNKKSDVAEDLFRKLTEERQSFWKAVYPLYMNREITRNHVRELVHRGLEEARGNYKIVLRLFNMENADYKRFLNFLRKHDCQLPFKEYR